MKRFLCKVMTIRILPNTAIRSVAPKLFLLPSRQHQSAEHCQTSFWTPLVIASLVYDIVGLLSITHPLLIAMKSSFFRRLAELPYRYLLGRVRKICRTTPT